MNGRQRRTLERITANPVSGTIAWADIESLLLAIGCRIIEGSGSRVRFEKDGLAASFHRPHPDKDAKRYQGAMRGTISENWGSDHERPEPSGILREDRVRRRG